MSVSAVRIPAATKPAKAAIIFVHGLGDSGDGWAWFPQLLKQSGAVASADSINYVFPNAPLQPVTANGGHVMPAWFDVYEFGNPGARQDAVGFFKSVDTLQALVHEQVNLAVPPEKIIIGGFSQGAAVSLAAGALLDVKIGGVVALAGFCPVKTELPQRLAASPANAATPIFQGHGTADPVVSYGYGELTSKFYRDLGFASLDFRSYPGVAHTTSEQELADVVRFIRDILA